MAVLEDIIYYYYYYPYIIIIIITVVTIDSHRIEPSKSFRDKLDLFEDDWTILLKTTALLYYHDDRIIILSLYYVRWVCN